MTRSNNQFFIHGVHFYPCWLSVAGCQLSERIHQLSTINHQLLQGWIKHFLTGIFYPTRRQIKEKQELRSKTFCSSFFFALFSFFFFLFLNFNERLKRKKQFGTTFSFCGGQLQRVFYACEQLPYVFFFFYHLAYFVVFV